MAAFEVIALDTATPQLRAPGASDTYTFPRDVEMPLGTANGVLYLNGSKVVTSGSALTFDASGNLLVGTTSASYSSSGRGVTILGGSASGLLGFQIGGVAKGYVSHFDTSMQMWNEANSPILFGTNAAERMRIDSSGNVGIGLSSPGARLDVKGLVRSSIGTGTGAGGAGYAFYQFGTSATATENWHIGAEGDGSFRFYNQGFGAGLERMRIDSSGNIVAGASAALATNATDGFLYVPTCAGTPTGTPTAITGMAPIVVDTTNNKLYFYSGGQWRDAGP